MNKKNIIIFTLFLGLFFYVFTNINEEHPINNYDTSSTQEKKIFSTSFESVDDFKGFYITPQSYKNTTFHELSESIVHSGKFSHKAWIKGENPTSTTMTNNNHRGYPTIQFNKTEGGILESPVYVTFWVWLDMDLNTSHDGGENDWFSFATFTDDESDRWKRTVLVNLSHDGFVHLMHTTDRGEKEYIFQTSSIKFPQKEWVELKVYLDFSDNSYAKVWQNGELVSHANIGNIKNRLAQAHFGMYSPPKMTSGIVYNDDLKIEMVDGE
ncbi:polysaccharide lyase [Candidatus Gracilibacteria bacterium 28_42_T64]|nr:polysaccharide lyase [Candidatus Gracilibacteria bacterium 28_42_T64]